MASYILLLLQGCLINPFGAGILFVCVCLLLFVFCCRPAPLPHAVSVGFTFVLACLVATGVACPVASGVVLCVFIFAVACPVAASVFSFCLLLC